MRDRRLSREEAIEEYLVYQLRLYDFLHLFQIAFEIKEGKYQPKSEVHGPDEFFGTVRSMFNGVLASLMDPQNHALDVFDVWVALFPKKEQRITEVWKKLQPHVQLIKDYRNDVAFHANKDLQRAFATRQKFHEARKEIVAAMQEFCGLAAELIREQSVALPDFRKEIEPAIKKTFPNAEGERMEKIKDYFIQNDPTK